MTSPSTNLPKSYMPAEEREKLLPRCSANFMYICESQYADEHGDEESAWKWLALVKDPPAHALGFLKDTCGAKFIRDMKFDTSVADVKYGQDWLDKGQ